ncbi:serine O-acetyltransferase [Synergistales bacterium]|nr:serine O-acetyltransferase [Synergistales bacterium]
MQDIIIYGAGGLGREILFLIENINTQKPEWNFLGFVDDGKPVGAPIGMKKIIGGGSWLASIDKPVAVVMGFADSGAKASLYDKLSLNKNIFFPVIKHPTALIASSSVLSEGVVVSAFCIVAPDAKIKQGVFLNWYSSVGHDSVLGDFCSVMPSVNLSGGVTVGDRTLIGVGAKIHQNLKIGSDAVVGMGSIVLSNVPDRCTVLGNPAIIIKKG